MYPIMHALANLTMEFSNKYQEEKKAKNIIDFNDIEHFALNLLLKKENDKYVPTEVAKSYREKFVEIAIDEYQDSNLVQEYILNAVSNGHNIFMVGDVKQSIYKFRQARPELFIDKYETYVTKNEENFVKNHVIDEEKRKYFNENNEEGSKENLKIQLFKNFRSRKNILDITNLVFENIMSKELGDIDYNEDEFLNLGANYEELEKDANFAGKTELLVIDLKEPEDKETDETEDVSDIVVEARLVADKIQALIQSKYQVFDKKVGYRNITYKDIVILLRATSNSAPIYEKSLNDFNIPVFSDSGTGYLESVEIQTIMSVLKIIDNPMQDIPLVCVLRSPIGGFSDNDLIKIKLEGYKKGQAYFYETLLEAKQNDTSLSEKIDKFLLLIQDFRNKKEYLPLDELIWQFYLDTGYYNYVGLMPNGQVRQANLKMLFEKAREYEVASFKGLFNFINFIDKLKTNNQDMDSAKIIGENEDVVRIMSIHKSKGLEFPVVFLCGTGKKFNLTDLNDNILLHQDIGFGPKFIDTERKIEYNTLAKIAIGYKSKTETVSEEMRILYVALTRAKEKLIITGLSKDFDKDIKKKKDLLEIYQQNSINPNIIKNYKSYLDWLELVSLNNENKINEIMDLQVYSKDELLNRWKDKNKDENENRLNIQDIIKDAKNDALNELLNWKYENIISTKIEAKSSVTKIKEKENENVKVLFQENEQFKKESLQKPKFLSEDVKITKARIGTLMHLCIQKMDEKEEYDYEKISNLINKLVQNKLITTKEADYIDIQKLLTYTESDLYKNLKKAKQIHKEEPFYINIDASEIYKEDINEKILVQGVIDLYYIDENDNIILVDYKTDYVKQNEQELVDKYKKQLSIYKEALEKALSKKVFKTYIYSVYLGKSIEIAK